MPSTPRHQPDRRATGKQQPGQDELVHWHRTTAGVAKWLRQRLVAPPFGGSSPLARPYSPGTSSPVFLSLHRQLASGCGSSTPFAAPAQRKGIKVTVLAPSTSREQPCRLVPGVPRLDAPANAQRLFRPPVLGGEAPMCRDEIDTAIITHKLLILFTSKILTQLQQTARAGTNPPTTTANTTFSEITVVEAAFKCNPLVASQQPNREADRMKGQAPRRAPARHHSNTQTATIPRIFLPETFQASAHIRFGIHQSTPRNPLDALACHQAPRTPSTAISSQSASGLNVLPWTTLLDDWNVRHPNQLQRSGFARQSWNL